MTKPKGKTPSLLTQGTGKPTVYKCVRKTKCTRCKEGILAGSNAFKIPKVVNGFTNKRPYCLECFQLILIQTQKDISELENVLNEKQKEEQ